MSHNITPMHWLNTEAEEAARFYVSLFEDARMTEVRRSGDGMPGEPGSALTVAFELEGRPFAALNRGLQFAFTEAISLVVNCETRGEVDRVWDAFTANGGEETMCGWLKDRFGLSWQIIPTAMPQMRRIEVAVLQEACDRASVTA